MSQPVILLVDDEADLLDVMRASFQFKMPDYEVAVARNIEDAMDVVDELDASGRELSLAVVDHVLGGRTGLEFIRLLHHRYPKVRKMMFTGQAPASVEHRARQIGAKVVWKPVALATLVGEVQQMLQA